jgi:hypothetical protein
MGYKNKMAKIILLPISDSLGSINPHPKTIRSVQWKFVWGTNFTFMPRKFIIPPEFVVIISYKCSGTNLFRFTTSKN